MATSKYYPEDELVQKLQDGEMDWLDFVNHHSQAWKEEYAAYCKSNNLLINDETAEKFVIYKGEQFEKAIAEGEA